MSYLEGPHTQPKTDNSDARKPHERSVQIIETQSRPNRKRNFADTEYDQIVEPNEAFTIRASTTTSRSRELTLIPRFCIQRGRLPLAALQLGSDPNSDEGLYPQFFSANIVTLREPLKGTSQYGHAILLIAEATTPGHGLYAIEKVDDTLHALVKLAKTIDTSGLQRVECLGLLDEVEGTNECQMEDHIGREWWASMRASKHSLKRRKFEENTRVKVSLQAHSETKKVLNEDHPEAPLEERHDEERDRSDLQPPDEVADLPLKNESQSPEEIITTIKAQYREALYISKTSLAYFAKGPLARARALLIDSENTALSLNLLIEQLGTNLLPLTAIDTKYRETIPEIVRDLPAMLHDSDDCEPYLTSLRKKAKKLRKDKVNKSGLHPGEEVDIARWWLTFDCFDLSNGDMPTQAELLKTRISKLRTRETQAQLILALEMIAMEQRKRSASGLSEPQTHRLEKEKQPVNRKKTKKSLDPQVLVEMMLDRLCIWQSMTTDEKGQTPHNKTEDSYPASKDGTYTSSDELKNFCIDVVVPFYSSRLPDLSSSICKKLGAPTPPSPVRPSSGRSLSGSNSRIVKPSAHTRRQPPPKQPRKTLERVLTDSQKPPLPRSRSHPIAAPPTLLRSITEPTLPSLKREASDHSLVSIPLNRAPSIHVQKRYSQREVDLRSAAAATEAKLKRKAAVEQELKGAIAAMKRPNARMAVKELVEASERRKEGTEKGRKRKSEPVRNPFAQGLGVQVVATPMKHRTRNMLQRPSLPRMAATQPLPFLHVQEEEDELEEIPQSSAGRVPESTIKQSIRRGDAQHRDVEQTPTRGSLISITPGLPLSSRGRLQRSLTTSSLVRQRSPVASQSDLLSLPTVRRPAALPTFATPTKPTSAMKTTPLRRSYSDVRPVSPVLASDAVGETPQKTPHQGSSIRDDFLSIAHTPEGAIFSPSPPVPAAQEAVEQQNGEKDIYAALGWNNDDDELLI